MPPGLLGMTQYDSCYMMQRSHISTNILWDACGGSGKDNSSNSPPTFSTSLIMFLRKVAASLDNRFLEIAQRNHDKITIQSLSDLLSSAHINRAVPMVLRQTQEYAPSLQMDRRAPFRSRCSSKESLTSSATRRRASSRSTPKLPRLNNRMIFIPF